MNKKGFTLVELLAVIVVLSLVITVVATKGFGAFDNAKTAINKQNEEAIIEGAKVLLVEIENCEAINDTNLNNLLDDNDKSCQYLTTNKRACKLLNGNACTDDFLNNNGFSSFSCDDIVCESSNICFDVELQYLITNQYVTGDGVKEVLENDPPYSVKVCLDGNVKVN